MSERDGYIPGVPCWVDTSQPDPEASLPFYSGLFGWEFNNVMPEGSGGDYFVGYIRGGDVAAVGTIPKVRRVWPPGTRTSGLTALMRPPPRPLRRAAGWRWSLSTSCKPAGWQCSPTLREPLSTSGRPRSTRVPRSSTSTAPSTSMVWPSGTSRGPRPSTAPSLGGGRWKCRWAYCGRSPATATTSKSAHPGLRQQMGQMGAPNGFIDVVAALNPIAGDDSQTPAHWNVTFGVDDAVVTAAKAKELGGQVVAGPYDAPWTRLAVIKDPQGATFVAGQFVPENRDLTA